MKTPPVSTAATYWIAVACVAALETTGCVATIVVWQSFFAGDTAPTLDGLVRNCVLGATGGLTSALFVMLATLPLMRSLRRRKGLFIALAGVGPLIGWVLVGLLETQITNGSNLGAWLTVGILACIGSVIVAVLATFFLGGSNPNVTSAEEERELNRKIDELGLNNVVIHSESK